MSLFGGVKLDPSFVKAVTTPKKEAAVLAAVVQPAKYTTFSRDTHFTVGDGDPQAPWKARKGEVKKSIKWGQLKLLVTEVQFLTLYWDPAQVPHPFLVYVGAADGTHIAVLQKMFPWFTFHLYDPRSDVNDKAKIPGSAFDRILEGNERIVIHRKAFGDEDIAEWQNRKDVFFVCDIRSTTYNRDETLTDAEQVVNEDLVWEDMLRQQAWVKAIRPVKAHLKFRLPYSYKFIKATGKTRAYLDGLVYIQPWGPQTTTECRLVPNDTLSPRDWDYEVHERMMFHHNSVAREDGLFANPITGGNERIGPTIGLYNDYDSTLTAVIVMEYLIKFGVAPTWDNVTDIAGSMILGANNQRTNLNGLRAGGKLIIKGDE